MYKWILIHDNDCYSAYSMLKTSRINKNRHNEIKLKYCGKQGKLNLDEMGGWVYASMHSLILGHFTTLCIKISVELIHLQLTSLYLILYANSGV